MSAFRVGIAVLAVAAALSSVEPAFGRIHIRLGGPLGAVRSVFSHLLPRPGLHVRRAYARHGERVRFAAARESADTAARGAAPTAIGPRTSDTAARGQIAAAAALAGWQGGRGASGWWRHGDGGYGWVGPLFWPFAYDDIYDYIVWGDGKGFWGYGYVDIYAAIFAPYGYGDLARYLARSRGRKHDRMPSLAEMCGDEKGVIADAAIDQIRQAIQPNDEQRAALDELASASGEAAKTIRATCPTQVASTASGRLAAMQLRLEAMSAAIARIRTPLQKLYELLDDEQQKRLMALAGDQVTDGDSRVPPAQRCRNAPHAPFQWPGSELEAKLRPNEAQRAALDELRDRSAKAKDILKDDCQPEDAQSPPARLAAADIQLDAMLQAIKLLRPALENFYTTLSDEQKAQFEAIGPKRTS
jgi:LTXXQ motif family protein